MSMDFLPSARKEFAYYRQLGEKTFAQLPDADLFREPAPGSNSIAVIVKHLHGNMRSRWTDFLTSDGEKPWRQRDAEFENDLRDRAELMTLWNEGWTCLFSAYRGAVRAPSTWRRACEPGRGAAGAEMRTGMERSPGEDGRCNRVPKLVR
ncbi:MAG: DUF1572 family protein [Flavobacteriales bacterium]|nr:DUF1572 family protein [Flavobacteriales bacterium]